MAVLRTGLLLLSRLLLSQESQVVLVPAGEPLVPLDGDDQVSVSRRVPRDDQEEEAECETRNHI